MSTLYLEKKRIRKLVLPNEFDINKIQIGIPIKANENEILNLNNIGDSVVPSPNLGINCKRNAFGYTYPNTNAKKEKRYISTIWVHPFGNELADQIAIDIYKECYPKAFVDPTEIEFCFFENDNDEKFIIAMLNEEIRANHLKEAVNLFLEIYGKCYIFDKEIKEVFERKYTRCNWEILPPGINPSEYVKRQTSDIKEKVNLFSIKRLSVIEKHHPIKSVQGTNGFIGYFAYVFNDFCILESAIYGNATYVIPSEDWEILSQKTKKELFDNNFVLNKIIHNVNWETEIEKIFVS